ncbi:4-hydroxythreonine-4-phosphate dehydrogenase [Fodinibius salinus]|uniref:4-hydroxythreonine-4-phosphate dehydrogenase n=1 Tax=Fodinibius salinus TaxID=860790 RepID=A0A5D3YMQ4_9BACT|nr:4-hydroxythreonine-4-phosphate dehydrogenase PdxA [Fodinibius salinus]TYP95154.1 4-hydroxythreonine-4-phosphate dehydrogenase [Fodinibius salinus]
MNNCIAITGGDFNGIGPEVILKTLSDQQDSNTTPVILSSPSVIDFYQSDLDSKIKYHLAQTAKDIRDDAINVLNPYKDESPVIEPGAFTKQSGKCAMLAVEKAIEFCLNGTTDAIVTAPISKEAVNIAGYNIPGHTEFLAEQTDTDEFMMMLVNNDLRVGLSSVHIPVKDVASSLSVDDITHQISLMNQSLQKDFSIARPKIAVLGLNPHAGDGGIIGSEETKIISPAINNARQQNIDASGPHPADGFFGNRKYENYDGILAMYHDQGLIPFKTLSFGAGVNFTAGLPIIRTSPDHGTAFDIAGQHKANPSSFKQAYKLADMLSKHRAKQTVSL